MSEYLLPKGTLALGDRALAPLLPWERAIAVATRGQSANLRAIVRAALHRNTNGLRVVSELGMEAGFIYAHIAGGQPYIHPEMCLSSQEDLASTLNEVATAAQLEPDERDAFEDAIVSLYQEQHRGAARAHFEKEAA